MEGRDLFPGDHSTDQVGLGMNNLGPEKENLRIDAIDCKHRKGIYKIFPDVLGADVKLVIKQRGHVKRSRR